MPWSLGVAALPRQSGELLGDEGLELVDADRLHALAAAHQNAQAFHGRGRLGVGIAALLGLLHLLAGLFHLLAEVLEFAERAVPVELHLAPGSPAAHRAAQRAGPQGARADDQASERGDNHREHDGADDDHRGVAEGLLLRALHQPRQAQVQQVQAVQAGQDRQDAQRRQDLQHPGHPGRRVRVDRHLERLRAVLLAPEGRGEGVDDEGEDRGCRQSP